MIAPYLKWARRHPGLTISAILAGSGILTVGCILFGGQSHPVEAHSLSKPGVRLASVRSKPSEERARDPRFVRLPPPKIQAVSSPEAQRMIVDMQNSYRCVHSGSPRPLPGCLPQDISGDAVDSVMDLETLAASLRQSLGALPDACYVTAALPQVVNPRTPAALMNTLYEDLARRPDPIRLRALFVIAGIESHPLAANALEDLQAQFGTDFQRDWMRWDQAISERLVREQRGVRGASCRYH